MKAKPIFAVIVVLGIYIYIHTYIYMAKEIRQNTNMNCPMHQYLPIIFLLLLRQGTSDTSNVIPRFSRAMVNDLSYISM